MSWQKEVDELKTRRTLAQQQGGAQAVARQHGKGRLSIRERIDLLTDAGSFRELGEGAGVPVFDDAGQLQDFQPANFVLGFATLNGRKIIVGGEDFTIRGGSPNPAGLRKSVYAEELALQYRLPLVRLHEGAGGSVTGASGERARQERPLGEPVFARNRFVPLAQALGLVPVAAAALGPVAGLPAARLVASHFSVMTENAQVLVAGPAVIERALGVKISKEELGGPEVHLRSGVVDNLARDEQDAMAQIARFFSYLPDNIYALPPSLSPDDDPARCEDGLLSVVPRERRKVYPVRKVIGWVLDRDSFFETGRRFGSSLVTGLARLNGKAVAVIANDCMFYAGAMTAQAAQKMRRFVDFCNTFHLPVISFVDEPGFMIGPDAEQAATIRHGTAAIAAVMQSRVPWASVVMRKVFGVAGVAHFAPDGFVLSWPSAETGALPVEGGVAVAFGREIAAADDPEAKRRELEEMLAAKQSPFPRAEGFSVHELIDPRETRPRLGDWLDTVSAAAGPPPGPYMTTMRP